MSVNKTIISTVKKSLQKFDFTKLEERCSNEARTRSYLIEPLLEILGYSSSSHNDMLTEFDAGWGKKNDKADIVLLPDNKTTEIVIECKKLGKKLTDTEASQLNGYFINTKNAKFGILTNGLEWKFYSINEASKDTKLHSTPFLVLDFSEITDELIEDFSKFHKSAQYLKKLYLEVQEIYFLQGFENAFASELADPSEEFIKAIFNRMHGKKLIDSTKTRIKNLINSNAIQAALPKVIEEESKNGSIVITTAEELKIYHSIKTLLLHSIRKLDPKRINYRDQKNSFNILVDDNNKKIICKITSSRGKYYLDLNGDKDEKFEVKGLESIVELKKDLINIASGLLGL
ncbi:MAG: hypothetical protein RJA67_140 [Bacteroidota bacterium]|jgi:hypothetical protein